jgi:hypothetical protein
MGPHWQACGRLLLWCWHQLLTKRFWQIHCRQPEPPRLVLLMLSAVPSPGLQDLRPRLLKLVLLFIQLCFPCLAQLLVLLLNCHLQKVEA